MKIIEILVKLANGEEAPDYISYYDLIEQKIMTMMASKSNIIHKLDIGALFLNSEVSTITEITINAKNGNFTFKEDKEVKPLTKKDVEALGYACGKIKRCFENGWNKSLKNEPLEDEDKDIPLIPDDELFLMKHNGADIRGFDYLDHNFKVLKEKINQIAEEFNEYRKEGK